MGSQSAVIRSNTGLRPDVKQILLGLDSGLGPIRGDVYYVDAVDGAAGNDGLSWSRPILTMATAFTKVKSGDTIVVVGKVKEQINAPVQVHDVTIIGAAPRTRHADTQPVDPSGRSHGATWTTPDSPTATTPLLLVRNQGWRFVNMLFDGPSDDACVELFADAGSGNDERDGSHASFINCKFANGQEGIKDTGGTHHVLVSGCEFNALTTAILTASTGVRVPSYWTVEDSIFVNNTNHIKVSMAYGAFRNNLLGKYTTSSLVTIQVSAQGEHNMIFGNQFFGTYDISSGYSGAATDNWAGNYAAGVSGAVTASDPA